jgi:hypothetical protein
VPLSIVVLQSLHCSPRADAILDRLQAHLAPAQRQSFHDCAAARLPCNLLPEEARADIEQRLDRIDRHWRDCIAIRAPGATMPGRFTRPRAPQQRHADRHG